MLTAEHSESSSSSLILLTHQQVLLTAGAILLLHPSGPLVGAPRAQRWSELYGRQLTSLWEEQEVKAVV